jgi:hypothetical protein
VNRLVLAVCTLIPMVGCQELLGIEKGEVRSSGGGGSGATTSIGGSGSGAAGGNSGGANAGGAGAGGDNAGGGGGGGDGPVSFVFVTDQTFTPGTEFTNIVGATDICNSEAGTGGLPGTYVAWLSEASNAAIDSIPDLFGPWYLSTGTDLVFADKTDITNGPAVAIDHDAMANPIAAGLPVFTGTLALGTVGEDCDAWKGGTHPVTLGAVSANAAAWTNNQQTNCGNAPARLYCFQVAP